MTLITLNCSESFLFERRAEPVWSCNFGDQRHQRQLSCKSTEQLHFHLTVLFFPPSPFLMQFFLTCVEKYHLQRMIKVTGTLHHASHFAATERISLIFEKIKKHRARERPSKVYFSLFFHLHSYKDTVTVIYQRANSSDVLPDILFIYFFLFNFQGQICVRKKKTHSKEVLFVNLSTAAVWDGPA